MAPLSVKVYGMTEVGNIREVERLGADMIGFISYLEPPRCLCELPDYLPVHAKRVGVFINENEENILMYVDCLALDYTQLHGDESPEYCRLLCNNGLHLIKALSISHPRDLMCTSAYKGLCDYYPLDAKTLQYDGSDDQFDWNLPYRYGGMTPFLLSGGTNPYSTKATEEFCHPKLAGTDINSRSETALRQKDVERIRNSLQETRNGETANKQHSP